MFYENYLQMLEFPAILAQLAEITRTRAARERALALMPHSNPDKWRRATEVTASARRVYDAMGAPPISSMEGLSTLWEKLRVGETLSIEELAAVADFLKHCRLLQRYAERAQLIDPLVAELGLSTDPLPELKQSIENCIHGGYVLDSASSLLADLRAQQQRLEARVREKLSNLLRAHPEWFMESFYSQRGGRYVLPVRREYKQKVPGSAVDASSSGATVFVEPNSIMEMRGELDLLKVSEENEVYRILAELSASVAEHAQELSINKGGMEEMDFALACGRLGNAMGGTTAQLSPRRAIVLDTARHPLLGPAAVPLSIELNVGGSRGLVITGPNTGGKTVSLKTIGLLSLMAMSGLQVPAKNAAVPLFSGVYCDIGDGQSIAQSLSTFSSHVTRLVHILENADGRSLVLLDELGSGTDPQEGMGLAVAVLEELIRRGCLFAATSHYPNIKEFASKTAGLSNARMLFNRATLSPTYQLEMGVAGESCALYIAKRIGLSEELLKRAWQYAYPAEGEMPKEALLDPPAPDEPDEPVFDEEMPMPTVVQQKREVPGSQFHLGDMVLITSMNQRGLVCKEANARGEVGVRVMGRNLLISHQRLKPFLAAEELYPDKENYDLDIVLTDKDNRRAKRDVRKGKAGATHVITEGKNET